MSDDIEHTLFVCRQVNLYRVPPKATAGGHKSGEWKVVDKIFTGRLKLTAKGDSAEVRLEDSDRYVTTYCGSGCSTCARLVLTEVLERLHAAAIYSLCAPCLLDKETSQWSLLQTAPETLCCAWSTLLPNGMPSWGWVFQSGMRPLTSMLPW